jgi:hypothetical protein
MHTYIHTHIRTYINTYIHPCMRARVYIAEFVWQFMICKLKCLTPCVLCHCLERPRLYAIIPDTVSIRPLTCTPCQSASNSANGSAHVPAWRWCGRRRSSSQGQSGSQRKGCQGASASRWNASVPCQCRCCYLFFFFQGPSHTHLFRFVCRANLTPKPRVQMPRRRSRPASAERYVILGPRRVCK